MYAKNFMQIILGAKAKQFINQGNKVKIILSTEMLGIYFFTYLRQTKLLATRISYLMHPYIVFIKTVFIK